MRSTTLIWVLLFLTPTAAAEQAIAANGPATRPAGNIERALAMVTGGMSHEQIGQIVRGERGVGQWADADWAVNGTGFGRFDFGEGRYLVVRYDDVGSVIRPGTKAASAEGVSIDDLPKDLPPDVAQAVRLVQLAPRVNGEQFDPAALVRAVSGLLPLGKQKALQALRFYSWLGGADFQLRWRYDIDVERVFLIARLLFVPGDGAERMSPMLLGGAVPDIGASSADWPLYPLAVQDELPFCLVSGYSLFGAPPSPIEFLSECERICVMRQGALVPRGAPGAAAEALCASPQWRRSFKGNVSEPQLKYRLRRQVLLGVRNLWADPPDWSLLDPQQPRQFDEVWASYLHHPLLARARWNAERQQFTLEK